MKQAILIAAVCEFGGAVLLVSGSECCVLPVTACCAAARKPPPIIFCPLAAQRTTTVNPCPPLSACPPSTQGAGVTSTIRSNIANLNDFRVGVQKGTGCMDCCATLLHKWGPPPRMPGSTLIFPSFAVQNKPDLYMYGMLCALLATGIWLIVATYFEVRTECWSRVGRLGRCRCHACSPPCLPHQLPLKSPAQAGIAALPPSQTTHLLIWLLPSRSSLCPPPTPSSVL